jgi:signal transduction histidine kinase
VSRASAQRPVRLYLQTEDTGPDRSYDRPVSILPTSPLRRDLLLATALAALAQVELFLTADQIDHPGWHHLVELLILPALALRRIAPLAASAIAAVSLGLEPFIGPAPVATPYLCLLLLLASVGWYASLRTGLMGVGMILGCLLIYDFTREQIVWADLVVNVVLIVVVWGAGHLLRVSTDRRVRSEVAAERAAAEAIRAERARIAGDLHDSLAHALTLITLQAGSARERKDHTLADGALAAIEQTGRDALADMQRFLALLGPGSPDAPGIQDLPGLVEQVRSGGIEVELDTEAGQVPPGISTTIFRVVQEALTNIVRHSDARTARVVVHRDGAELVARVSDDGRAVPERTKGSGRGLAGLTERVRVFDGTVSSGRTERGWQVEARIPLVEASA